MTAALSNTIHSLRTLKNHVRNIPLVGRLLRYPYRAIITLREMRITQSAVLQKLLQKTAFYQPLYGYLPINDRIPERPCIDRADAILNGLKEMGQTVVLDVGCSFGYFSYYFADRGYSVEGIDSDPACVDICHFLQKFSVKNTPRITHTHFDLHYIQTIPSHKYDVAFLLSVLHHITSAQGIAYVQEMLRCLLEKIPVLIVELAVREEEAPFPWRDRLPRNELEVFATCQDIDIVKLGCFSTHLSAIKRPLYKISKNTLVINQQKYHILKRRFVANLDAHYYFRVFYETSDAFIKEYRLQDLDNQPLL